MNKQRWSTFALLMVFGLLPLMNSFNNPRLQSLHVPDRLQLVASGLCFGMGIGVLVGGRKKFRGE